MIAVGFALLGQNAFRGGVGGSSGCTFGTIVYPFRGVKLVGVCGSQSAPGRDGYKVHFTMLEP
jgi:hypothetical protein